MNIACLPVSVPRSKVPPGSTVRAASCGHAVWVSPETVREIEQHGMTIKCVDCVRSEHEIVTAQLIKWAMEAVR